eukprot:Hpha_TRINITY_DN33959_c0_g1::TRINITY_DN33959_c0_g1_i1::g.69499::m.69499
MQSHRMLTQVSLFVLLSTLRYARADNSDTVSATGLSLALSSASGPDADTPRLLSDPPCVEAAVTNPTDQPITIDLARTPLGETIAVVFLIKDPDGEVVGYRGPTG